METIVFAGCGGGYDIFGCLPLLYEIKDDQNKQIILTSLSFTSVVRLKELLIQYPDKVIQICEDCFEINEGNYADDVFYFPEYLLANKVHLPVYVMGNYETVDKIMNFYLSIYKFKNINAVNKFYLVDGGCDVLLKGSESGLATFVEDMMNLKAIMNIINKKMADIKEFYVCAIGMNVECGHGVIEKELLNRLKELDDNNITITKEILSLSQDKTKFYKEIVLQCNPGHSLVQSFVLCALNDKIGYIVPEYENTKIGKNTKVNVSNLTKTFLICNGTKLASSILYLDMITDFMSSDEVGELENHFYKFKT